MEVKELQKTCNEFLDLLYEKFNCDHNANNTILHLAEEVGEISREINKPNIRKNEEFDLENLKEQVGDVMTLIMRLANIYNIDLEETIKNKIKKIKQRENIETYREIINLEPKREFISTVYIVEDEKVLLNKNKKLQKFIPLGGHIEENELPCESAIREAKEESGFDIRLINPDSTRSSGKEVKYGEHSGRTYLPQNLSIGLDIIKQDHHHINISYIAKIISGKQLEKADDNTELKWFSQEELKDCPDVLDNVKQEALKAIEIINNLKE